jgi:hypothetical protein
MRYLARQGVTDWMVWDREKRCPAHFAGRKLLKLPKDEAMRLQAELNGVEPPVTTPKVEMTATEIALFIRAESDLSMQWPRGAEMTFMERESAVGASAFRSAWRDPFASKAR